METFVSPINQPSTWGWRRPTSAIVGTWIGRTGLLSTSGLVFPGVSGRLVPIESHDEWSGPSRWSIWVRSRRCGYVLELLLTSFSRQECIQLATQLLAEDLPSDLGECLLLFLKYMIPAPRGKLSESFAGELWFIGDLRLHLRRQYVHQHIARHPMRPIELLAISVI